MAQPNSGSKSSPGSTSGSSTSNKSSSSVLESGSPSYNSGSQSAGSTTSSTTNSMGSQKQNSMNIDGGHDVIRDSLVNAVGTVVQALEPQINEFSARMASQAVDRSKDLVTAGYAKVQKQPWYLVGFAAFLLVGAAVMIGFGERSTIDLPDFSH